MRLTYYPHMVPSIADVTCVSNGRNLGVIFAKHWVSGVIELRILTVCGNFTETLIGGYIYINQEQSRYVR